MSIEMYHVQPWEHDKALMCVTVLGMRYGDFTFTIGGEKTTEFVVAKDSAGFRYRGRTYFGKIMLKRDTLGRDAAPGYSWQLKNEKGVSASRPVYEAIVSAVTATILTALEERPEILVRSERASLAAKLEEAEHVSAKLSLDFHLAQQREAELLAELREYDVNHREVLS